MIITLINSFLDWHYSVDIAHILAQEY